MVRHALLGSKKQMDSEQFIEALYSVDPSLRAVYLPRAGDTTVTTTLGRVWTYTANIAAHITPQGNGVLVSFGATRYGVTPDTANLSFGNGSNDSPCSFVGLANVTNTSSERPIITKWNGTFPAFEWQLGITPSGTLRFAALDASASLNVSRSSNAAITTGSLALFGAVYDGRGGATAMDGVTLYQNAAVVASTATNDASYVAMENTTSSVEIGSIDDGVAIFNDTMGFVAVWAGALSATQMEAVKLAVEEYYGVNL